jgi:hypothetical protein
LDFYLLSGSGSNLLTVKKQYYFFKIQAGQDDRLFAALGFSGDKCELQMCQASTGGLLTIYKVLPSIC